MKIEGRARIFSVYYLGTDGHPRTFGYKHFILDFTGEIFDVDKWMDPFKSAGVQYSELVEEYHDGFAMLIRVGFKWRP